MNADSSSNDGNGEESGERRGVREEEERGDWGGEGVSARGEAVDVKRSANSLWEKG